MNDDVSLTVNGTTVSGWKSVRITRGTERIPADFDISMTERFPDSSKIVVMEGDPCVVKQPFGITVKALVPGMLHPQVCLNVGESPYAVIDRLCKLAQVLCYEDADGDLVIGPLSAVEAAGGFALRVNIEQAGYMRDISQRFSEYRVSGIFTDAGQQPLAEYAVADDTMPHFRPKAFIAQNGDAGAEVSNAHALWECHRRIGRGNVLTLTATSWRDSEGVLYTPNTLAALSLPQLKVIDGAKWTIGEVTYRRDMSGTGCELVLMPPEAFQPEPILYLPLPADAAAALARH